MTKELKTQADIIKEWDEWAGYLPTADRVVIRNKVLEAQEDLRNEAVRWVKDKLDSMERIKLVRISNKKHVGGIWEGCIPDECDIEDVWCGIADAFIRFFNLTSEDLK